MKGVILVIENDNTISTISLFFWAVVSYKETILCKYNFIDLKRK